MISLRPSTLLYACVHPTFCDSETSNHLKSAEWSPPKEMFLIILLCINIFTFPNQLKFITFSFMDHSFFLSFFYFSKKFFKSSIIPLLFIFITNYFGEKKKKENTKEDTFFVFKSKLHIYIFLTFFFSFFSLTLYF